MSCYGLTWNNGFWRFTQEDDEPDEYQIQYRIVMVEMGKVKLELFGRIVELKLLPEDAQWAN